MAVLWYLGQCSGVLRRFRGSVVPDMAVPAAQSVDSATVLGVVLCSNMSSKYRVGLVRYKQLKFTCHLGSIC
jgi:hypothetical protein